MIRYLYTSQYPRPVAPLSAVDTWEADFELAVVADKYQMTSLEIVAATRCAEVLELRHSTGDIICLIEGLPRYPDSTGYLKEAVVEVGWDSDTLVDLYRHDVFRAWVKENRAATTNMIANSLPELMKLEEFRREIQADGEQALTHIDILLGQRDVMQRTIKDLRSRQRKR